MTDLLCYIISHSISTIIEYLISYLAWNSERSYSSQQSKESKQLRIGHDQWKYVESSTRKYSTTPGNEKARRNYAAFNTKILQLWEESSWIHQEYFTVSSTTILFLNLSTHS